MIREFINQFRLRGFDSTDPTSSVNSAGFRNSRSGAGSRSDKGDVSGLDWYPLRLPASTLEIMYLQSWVAAKLIDMPVNDMFIRGRVWTTDDLNAVDRLVEAERHLQSVSKLRKAMKLSRLFGSAVVIMVLKGHDLREPLNIETVREGDLVNLLVFDRRDLSVSEVVDDIENPDYNRPAVYRVDGVDGQGFEVHYSRVLRFDGREELSTNSWQIAADKWWGVSVLSQAITEVFRYASLNSNIAHLVEESSMVYVKMERFNDMLTGEGEISIEEYADNFSLNKSTYKTGFMDKSDDIGRVEVSFMGLAAILDRYGTIMPAIADIPATRFMGRSPGRVRRHGRERHDELRYPRRRVAGNALAAGSEQV